MEIGRYLDFHTNNDEGDYTARYEIRNGTKGWEIYNSVNYNCQDIYIRSDLRDKSEITPLLGSLGILSHFNPKTYYLHDEPTKTAGLIAQEVLEVFEEAVVESTNERGEQRYVLRPAAMVALLVGAVNELHAEVAELKKQLPKA